MLKMLAKKTATKKLSDKEKKDFVWSDDEVELLLNIVVRYKVPKAVLVDHTFQIPHLSGAHFRIFRAHTR